MKPIILEINVSKFTPFPEEFPNKGEYAVYSSSWKKEGYRKTPQYPGQMPITFPEDASLLEIQLGGYIEVPQ